MRTRWFVAALAMMFVIGTAGCDKVKEMVGGGEEAAQEAEAAKKEAEEAKASAEAEKKKAEDALKKVDEAKKSAEEAKKSEEEARKATEEAVRKAEDEKRKAEEAKLQAAQEANRVKRDALGSRLAEQTQEVSRLGTELNAGFAAWKGRDQAKADELAGLLQRVAELDSGLKEVELLMEQEKFDEAETRLKTIQGRLTPVKETAMPLLADRPVDEALWGKMLDILAEENCLKRKNMPVQEFSRSYQGLFDTYGMDRNQYEELRAKFQREARPEDQQKLQDLIKQKCADVTATPTQDAPATPEGQPAGEQPVAEQPVGEQPVAEQPVADQPAEEPDMGDTQEATGETPEAPAGDKAPSEEKKVTNSGTYSGKVTVNGKTGTMKVIVKGKTVSGHAALPGANIKISGTASKGLKFSGVHTKSNISCTGTFGTGHISGNCNGTLNAKSFRYTFKLSTK